MNAEWINRDNWDEVEWANREHVDARSPDSRDRTPSNNQDVRTSDPAGCTRGRIDPRPHHCCRGDDDDRRARWPGWRTGIFVGRACIRRNGGVRRLVHPMAHGDVDGLTSRQDCGSRNHWSSRMPRVGSYRRVSDFSQVLVDSLKQRPEYLAVDTKLLTQRGLSARGDSTSQLMDNGRCTPFCWFLCNC